MQKKTGYIFVTIFLFILTMHLTAEKKSVVINDGWNVPQSFLKKISIDFDNVTLEKAFSEIMNKGGIKINYNRDRIPLNYTVSMRMDNVPAIEVLVKILDNTGAGLVITKGDHLAVVPAKKPRSVIRGTVCEQGTGKPLPDVNVVILGTQRGAATGIDGRFTIPRLSTGIYTIAASMIGYAKKKIENIVVTENVTIDVRFELPEEPFTLNEVSVTSNYKMSSSSSAKEFYERGMTLYEEGNIDSAIVLIENALKADKTFARAYEMLALMLVEKGDVYSRVLAERAIKNAIELEPGEAGFHINYGKLMLEQGFRYNARKRFEYTIELDTENVEAYNLVGEIYRKEVEEFKNSVKGPASAFFDANLIDYIRTYNPDGDPAAISFNREVGSLNIIDYEKFVKEDQKSAVSYFSKALDLDSTNKNSLHNMALLSMEDDNYNEFVDYQKKIIKHHPNDKDAHLFLGFGYHRLRRDDKAYGEYMKAKTLMESDEKEVFETIEYIVPADTIDDYKKFGTADKEDYEKIFWKERDPLYLSDYNERELEHYTRVAYADLKYGVKKMKMPGWKSDRGMIYIRYGEPIKVIKTRPGIPDDESTGELGFSEIWYYDDFTFIFIDTWRSGNYSLGSPAEPGFGGIHFREIVELEYKKRPEIYIPAFEGKTFEFGYYPVSFRGDNNKSIIEVYWALPVNELEPKKDKDLMTSTLKEGIFFFDDRYNEIDRHISREKISVSPDIDPAMDYHIIGKNELEIEPGSYNFAVEFQEEETKNTGAYKSKLKVDSYPFGKLNISDILLASKIEDADGDPKYTKNGLKVIPNPARIFHRGQLMYVYFEIYDLIVNTSRKTKFQVEYTVSSAEKENIPVIKKFLTGIGKLVGMKEEKNEISASYEYEGTYPTDKINLSIDMSATKTGLYNLAIKVKDINSGKEISKNVRFGVQESLINYLF